MNSKDSFGIYQIGHGGQEQTFGFWRRQREAILKRLNMISNNPRKLKEAQDIIDQAIKDNPLKNNLPF